MLEQRHPFSATCALFCIPTLQNIQLLAQKNPGMCRIAAQATGIFSASQFVYQMSVCGRENSFGRVELLTCFLLRHTNSSFIDLLLPMTNPLCLQYTDSTPWLLSKCSYYFHLLLPTFISYKWNPLKKKIIPSSINHAILVRENGASGAGTLGVRWEYLDGMPVYYSIYPVNKSETSMGSLLCSSRQTLR